MKETDYQRFDLDDLKDPGDLFTVKNNSPGKLIKAFRSNFGVTQKEICEITGINEKNFSAIENDNRDVGVHIAKKIGAFFGIDPALVLFPNGMDEALKEHKEIRRKAGHLIKQKLKKTG